MRQLLTQERLRALLHYNEDTGEFTRSARRQGVKIGAVAGTLTADGYVRIRVDGTTYRAHRLAWLYVFGRWPYDKIDHIDGDPSNNRIANLRECNQAENLQNQVKRSKPTTSKYLGVSRCKQTGRWLACINRKNLGRFDTPELAHAAYLAAKEEFHQFNPIPRKGMR